jgi:hypothetical protein
MLFYQKSEFSLVIKKWLIWLIKNRLTFLRKIIIFSYAAIFGIIIFAFTA